MREKLTEKAAEFSFINSIAVKGGIVVFGSTYMAGFPLYELLDKCRLEHAVYNRSIEGLTLDEAAELIDVCAVDLAPHKLFLALGDHDCSDPNAADKYKKLIETLRLRLPDTRIFVTGIPNADAAHFNAEVKKLCRTLGITYIDLETSAATQSGRYIATFKRLSSRFHDTPPSMADAFAISEIV